MTDQPAFALRAAADELDRTGLPPHYSNTFDSGAAWAANQLRRMADEADAGVRDAARQASTQQPDAAVPLAIPRDAAEAVYATLGELLAPTVGQQDATQPTTDETQAQQCPHDELYEVLTESVAWVSGEPHAEATRLIAAQRAAVLREAADKVEGLLVETPEYGQFVAEFLRGMAAGAETTVEEDETR